MVTAEHEVKTALREEGDWGLTCECGWTSLASSEEFTDAIARRHYLTMEIWPFSEDEKPQGWPYNE